MRFSEPLVEFVAEGARQQREFFGPFPGSYTMGTVVGRFREYGKNKIEALRVEIDGVEHIAQPSMGHWRATPINPYHPIPFDIVDTYSRCPECNASWRVFGPAVVEDGHCQPTNMRRCIECKTVVRLPDNARVGAE